MSALLGRLGKAMLLLAALVYIGAYLAHPALPGANQLLPLGWWGWWDQGWYLKSANALAQLSFDPSSHWYPVGYPALGALFVRFIPQHPFLIPNLLCFLGMMVVLFRIFRAFLSRLESVVLLGVCLLQQLFLEHLLIPWSTIPTQLGTYVIILLLVVRRPQRRDLLIASAVAGAMALFRPGDVVFVFPLFVAAVCYRLPLRRAVGEAVMAVSVVAGFILLALLINRGVFGVFWATPYTKVVDGIGFGVTSFWIDLYGLLVSAREVFALDTPMLLERYPWLLITLPGVAVLIQRLGLRGVALAASVLITFSFYLAYQDFDASTAFRFNTIHYLLWILPLALLAAYLTLRSAWKRLRLRLLLPLLCAPCLCVASVHVESVDVGPAEVSFNGGADETALLFDGRRWSFATATFPNKDNEIIAASFTQPTALRVIQLYGWPDNRYTQPALRINGRELKSNADYRLAFGPRGLMILLRRGVQARRMAIRVHGAYQGPVGISELRFASIRARLGAPWNWRAGREDPAVSPDGLEATYRGQGLVGDRVGPWSACDVGDDRLDHSIELSLPGDLSRRLRALDLVSSGKNDGRWTSCPGPDGYWRLALSNAANRTRSARSQRSGLPRFWAKTLVSFSDNGAIARGDGFELVGYDHRGLELFRVPVTMGSAHDQVSKAPPEASRLSIPTYRFGETIAYGRGDGLFLRWHRAEGGFRWSSGVSMLRFNLASAPIGPVRLELSTTTSNGVQHVRVICNHTRLPALVIPARRTTQTLTLPKNALRQGPNLITFRVPGATRPVNGDLRTLGIAVESVRLYTGK